jgi:hypothetical protein
VAPTFRVAADPVGTWRRGRSARVLSGLSPRFPLRFEPEFPSDPNSIQTVLMAFASGSMARRYSLNDLTAWRITTFGACSRTIARTDAFASSSI